MQRVVIPQPFEVGIEEAAAPEPGPGQLLVRSTITGISAGTEMNLYRGTNPDLVRRRWGQQWVYPMNPGYQSVGFVLECGPGVTEFKSEDRVIAGGNHAEYSLVSARNAIRLPDRVGDDVASMVSVAKVALHGVRRGRIEYGDNVAVVGMGLMGQLAMQHARMAGAGRIVAVDIDPWRLEVASRFGADHTINPEQEDPDERMTEFTGIGADVVLETAGVAPAVPVALKLARYGARVVIVGWHLQSIAIDLAEDLLYKELGIF